MRNLKSGLIEQGSKSKSGNQNYDAKIWIL
jgi:hypothetical protein